MGEEEPESDEPPRELSLIESALLGDVKPIQEGLTAPTTLTPDGLFDESKDSQDAVEMDSVAPASGNQLESGKRPKFANMPG
eukprot:8436494-Heterocapsa_arctica.AAC.1